MRYDLHDTLVAPARAETALWRVLVGLALIFIGYALATMALLYGLFVLDDGTVETMVSDAPAGAIPTLALLVSFAGALPGVWLAARLHKRSVRSLFGRAPTLLLHFATALGLTAVVALPLVLLTLVVEDVARGLPLWLWAALLPVSLVAVLIQTGAEELVFRGYLQSQLAARFRSPLVWLVLPALIFGALHYAPMEQGANAPVVAGSAALFGLLAADLTARTGSIGAAWGLHFANNTSVLLLLSPEGALSGLSLYRLPFGTDAPIPPHLIALDAALLVLVWWLIRRRLAV